MKDDRSVAFARAAFITDHCETTEFTGDSPELVQNLVYDFGLGGKVILVCGQTFINVFSLSPEWVACSFEMEILDFYVVKQADKLQFSKIWAAGKGRLPHVDHCLDPMLTQRFQKLGRAPLLVTYADYEWYLRPAGQHGRN